MYRATIFDPDSALGIAILSSKGFVLNDEYHLIISLNSSYK